MSFALKIVKHSSCSKLFSREIHLNAVCHLNKKWREDRKLPANPTSFGPLTNLPDYSFVDNRVVPYGANQKRRIDEQRKILLRVKELVGQIDGAVERYNLLQKQEEERKQQILDSKLKAKGSKLLTTAEDNENVK